MAKGLSCHVQEWNLDDTDFEGLIYRYLSIKESNKISCKCCEKNCSYTTSNIIGSQGERSLLL